MRDLVGKVVVITGAASGVGKCLALRYASAGARIVLADIEEEALARAVAEVESTGAKAIGQVTDVVKREQVDALRDRAYAEFGQVDIVFNNAGVGGGGGPTVWETSENAYRWTMDVNFFGPLNGLLSFLPRLIEQDREALIASTSSAAGIIYPPSAPAYSASKAALGALMEVTALQLQMAGSKVKAALLFPGPNVVDTNLFSSHRNVQNEYADASIATGSGVNNMEQFQAVMTMMLGHPVDLTSPQDFADEVFQSLGRDEFYVLPLHDSTKAAVRKRYEIMLDRGQPVIPDMF